MARHLLVSLVFLLLVIDLASPNVVGEKDSVAEKMMNKITNQDVHDKNVRKESLDEVSTLGKGLDKSFSTFNNDVPLLLTINAAKKLAQGKCNLTVPSRNRKKERKSALRKDYQAYQHGVKDFISDKKWLDAKRSEKCTSCVLDELCKDLSVLGELSIANLPKGERERACKRKILKKAIDIYPIKVHSIQCDWNTTFRTIDGTCNNLENPIFGSVGSKFTRVAEADYGDCISEPRRSVTGKVLPNARDVSRFVHGSNADRSNPNSKILTHLAMNFGQFLDHDITLAEAQGLNCEPPADKKNSECINIHIPKDDATFREREVDFIEMERDAPHVPVSHCKLVVREHSNTITAFIDASNVYGSTKQVADSLRAPDGLLLDMEHPHGCPFKNLLPAQTQGFCPSRDPNRPCFVTGDIRNNENQGLNSLHTIFTRHHNRIATFFGQKTTWDAEKIYQETRRIIGAQMQIITYGEFLPLILSEHTIKTFGLKLLEGDQFFNGYDKTVDAQMSTAFAVAGYRFGHSLVQELFNRFSQAGFEHKCDKGKSKFLPIPVLDFNNPQYLYDTGKGGIDSILRGLVKDPAGKADGRFSSSVQENLRRGEGDLSDLVAINIKRGRDRGAPGYIIYRNLKLCNLTEVKSFLDLEKKAGFYPKDVANLKKIYKGRIEDIDLFTGGMLEGVDPKGGVLGPTFQCIVAEQFKRLKIGDRFWHENEANAYLNTDKTAFNHCQLRELRKTLFSKIICENSDDFSAIPRWAMKQSKIRVSCDALPKLNLEAWIPECESEWNIWQGKR